jgi:hypothetical protein
MGEKKDSCVEPAKGPLMAVGAGTTESSAHENPHQPGGIVMKAQIGKPAPDFEAAAYVDGGFKNIKLSDYKGKWVTLCFYPGDFTFV